MKIKEFLDIKLFDQSIAKILLIDNSNSVFVFNEEYEKDVNKHPLSLSFYSNKEDLENGNLTLKENTSKAHINIIQNFFSNLLPEGELKRFLCEKYNIKQVREYDLLKVLGQDLSGAVTATPIVLKKEIDFGNKHHFKEVVREKFNENEEEIKPFSLSGYQLKFSLLKEDLEKHRFTLPANNSKQNGNYILKLPSLDYDKVPENEFSFMFLCKKIGIETPDCSLVKLNEINNLPDLKNFNLNDNAFIINRFDRNYVNGVLEKTHIEDFCQILNIRSQQKYDGNISLILNIIKNFSSQPQKDINEFFRRLTYCTLIGNGDMHFKNWSFIYQDGKPRLSPAYDILTTLPYIPNEKFALNIVKGAKNFSDFNIKNIFKICDKLQLNSKDVFNVICETRNLFEENWEREKTNLYLSKEVISQIERHKRFISYSLNEFDNYKNQIKTRKAFKI